MQAPIHPNVSFQTRHASKTQPQALQVSNVSSPIATQTNIFAENALSVSPSLYFEGLKPSLTKRLQPILLALAGFIGMNGSLYLGLKATTSALKTPIKQHAKDAASETGKLISQDAEDLRKDIAEINPFPKDAMIHDAKALAKKKAEEAVEYAKDKYKTIKQLTGKLGSGKGKDMTELEKSMEQLSPKDLKALEEILNGNEGKSQTETVQYFKAELDTLLKKRVQNTHLSPKSYEPMIEAAVDDASSIILKYGAITGVGFTTSLAIFLLGLVKTVQQRKEEQTVTNAAP
ncbi:MAG: hypothetical protein K2X66_12750 [Cyanobacteria bacterium]|nr:hypothetical protein [Cyanobacteriota bacterium]